MAEGFPWPPPESGPPVLPPRLCPATTTPWHLRQGRVAALVATTFSASAKRPMEAGHGLFGDAFGGFLRPRTEPLVFSGKWKEGGWRCTWPALPPRQLQGHGPSWRLEAFGSLRHQRGSLGRCCQVGPGSRATLLARLGQAWRHPLQPLPSPGGCLRQGRLCHGQASLGQPSTSASATQAAAHFEVCSWHPSWPRAGIPAASKVFLAGALGGGATGLPLEPSLCFHRRIQGPQVRPSLSA